MSSRLYFVAVIAGLSVAHARAADPSGYLVQSQDGAPVTTGHGECVHTGAWTPDSSYRQCSPRPVALAEVPAFDFDSAVLKANARPALDELARQLSQAQYQKIDIVGHADRIGPAKYNQRLSEKRARAVREYLVAQGIDGARIAVSGVGSSEPVTGSDCEGLRGKHLVSCLGRDRYAVVVVAGTRTSGTALHRAVRDAPNIGAVVFSPNTQGGDSGTQIHRLP